MLGRIGSLAYKIELLMIWKEGKGRDGKTRLEGNGGEGMEDWFKSKDQGRYRADGGGGGEVDAGRDGIEMATSSFRMVARCSRRSPQV